MLATDLTVSLKQRAEEVMEFAQGQVLNLITAYPDFYPMFTEGGKWKHGKQAWTRWCDGFLPRDDVDFRPTLRRPRLDQARRALLAR